ncbi:MAG: sulfotransferase domain-containing protein [Kiritimatiellae bacterium]|nr:sulfotransferase domain-containing protein [Kiritimatiellia bacterium]
MTYPNFLLIGPPKSGSTSLYHYLRQHPDVFMSPVKEPRFFGLDQNAAAIECERRRELPESELINDIETYKSLFSGVRHEKAVGEASARYLMTPGVPERIYAYNPEMKMITVLRQPADRAYSNYWWRKTSSIESAQTFAQALEEERSGKRDKWPRGRYIEGGYYANALKQYFRVFSRAQIKVYIFDDFIADPIGICQEIFEFLNVDSDFTPNVEKVWYSSGSFSNRIFQKLWDKSLVLRNAIRPHLPLGIRGWAFERVTSGMKKTPVPADERAELTEGYRDDILELQELIGRNLGHWFDAKNVVES